MDLERRKRVRPSKHKSYGKGGSMEKLKMLYKICLANGTVENGVVKCNLTRKEVAEQIGINSSNMAYLLKFIKENNLPSIEFKPGARGKRKLDRSQLIDEIKRSIGL